VETLFAVTAPGLSRFTRQELHQIGLNLSGFETNPREKERSEGITGDPADGVLFEGDLRTIYQANLLLRTASRVLVRFGSFYTSAFSELEKKSSRLPWESYLVPGQPVALRVTCHKSRLYHSDAVARTVVKGISNRLNRPSALVKFTEDNVTSPVQLIIVRLVHDHCTISVDSSGASLHRRGYRLAATKAPLRENLAAGIILASGWDKASPLLDPFCGSGTLPIEAARIARNIPAAGDRRFAFFDWPGFDRVLWDSLLLEANRQIQDQCPPIYASDRDAGAIRMAQANAERAGVTDSIEFSRKVISEIEPSGTGWVVTNPPYGIRVRSNRDLRNLYAQFGNVLRKKCPGWNISVLCNNYQLLGNIGLAFETQLSLVNGGIPVKLFRGFVPANSQ
jgi:putative N6-adenine-specific DNA methylase